MSELRVELETLMQLDDLEDLVPTIADLSKYGFKSGDRVKVTIEKTVKT